MARADFTLELGYDLESGEVHRRASIHGGLEHSSIWTPWVLEFESSRNAADRLALKGRLEEPAIFVEPRIWETLCPRFWTLAPQIADDLCGRVGSIESDQAALFDMVRTSLYLMATADERAGTIEAHQLRLAVGLGDDFDPILILAAILEVDRVTGQRTRPVRLTQEVSGPDPRLTPGLLRLRVELADRFGADIEAFLDGMPLS